MGPASGDADDVVPAVVIGAGVVGLAVARALARAGVPPIIIEREREIGQHQSSRNSEVLHAGIYYPPGSLKATLCVRGREQLLAYCERHDIGYRLCGKLIVATDPAQRQTLDDLAANARASGVDTLRPYSAAQARALEPNLRCDAALFSPGTGVIDSHALLQSLLGQALDHGAQLVRQTQVAGLRVQGDGTIAVHTRRDGIAPHPDPTAATRTINAANALGDGALGPDVHTVRAPIVVNAAAYGAQAIAQTVLHPRTEVPARHLAKGTYFMVPGRPFTRLIYPVPASASLGIHVTVDLAGEVRVGPDQQWVDEIDYTADAGRAAAFATAVQQYFPGLNPVSLTPGYVGVRNKVQAPGEPMADFVVHDASAHGLTGLVNLFGIESPGLTACLALADHVVGRLNLPATPTP